MKSEVERFVKDLQESAELQEKFRGNGNPDSLPELIRECGYDFTTDELKEFLKTPASDPFKELTMEELENVAGGMSMSISVKASLVSLGLLSAMCG